MSSLVPTPAFIIDLDKIEANLRTLAEVKEQANCRIVLALKAFSLWQTFPLISRYLDGCCASGVYEAQLSHEHMGKHTLTYSPAYKREEIEQLLTFSTHIDFNSIQQWKCFKDLCLTHPRYLAGEIQFGMRINPEHSTGATEKYDACSPFSRLGATKKTIRNADLTGISGLHFHTLCEQYTEDLESTLEAIDHRFGDILMSPEITWLNMGGGHWITKPDYQREKLIHLIKKVKERYDLKEIWLEPGEAVVIHAGTLESTVLDLVENGKNTIAVLDISPTAHMPDTLEMPYHPVIIDAQENQLVTADQHVENSYSYYIGGLTCLAGDQLGPYHFSRELQIGDRLIFDDMAQYTMVKTTMFNGVPHPSILLKQGEKTETVKTFNYNDFKSKFS